MAEHAGQADDLERPVGQWHFKDLGQACQDRGCRRVGHGGQPQLAVPRIVELAWFAEGVQLFGGAFDAAAFFAHQVQLGARQPCRHSLEDVVGEVLGLGQEYHGSVEGTLRYIHPEMAALGKPRIQRRLIARMPAPAMGIGQAAQQVVGGQAGQ
jgi:hypothetical protein